MWTGSLNAGSARWSLTAARLCSAISRSMASTCRLSATSATPRLTRGSAASTTRRRPTPPTGHSSETRTAWERTSRTLPTLWTAWWKRRWTTLDRRLRPPFGGSVTELNWTFAWSRTMLSAKCSVRCVPSDSGHCRTCDVICAHTQVTTLSVVKIL